jgi:hypothetical protein
MKKSKKEKRLLLTTERVRDLRPMTPEELAQVDGGGNAAFRCSYTREDSCPTA